MFWYSMLKYILVYTNLVLSSHHKYNFPTQIFKNVQVFHILQFWFTFRMFRILLFEYACIKKIKFYVNRKEITSNNLLPPKSPSLPALCQVLWRRRRWWSWLPSHQTPSLVPAPSSSPGSWQFLDFNSYFFIYLKFW